MLERHGLIIVHTGDGKGKTTAALGLAVRAFGAGLKVLILQFIKGGRRPGELTALEILGVEVRQLGLGFITAENFSEQKKSARAALEIAQKEISSGAWDLIILDEINYAVKFGLFGAEEILSLIKIRPPQLHLVFTGRNALLELIDAADLVTEMKLIKHPFQNGIAAQEGIEF
ncbi:MAG: cob(I)yrinic acid a,c-diamide adenosyltransferase [Selenomonadaceae bacterium]|nr:cob(I)yrinic acid a,c-diamide adenosyltransferase [Selenomonadaceae bacterium]